MKQWIQKTKNFVTTLKSVMQSEREAKLALEESRSNLNPLYREKLTVHQQLEAASHQKTLRDRALPWGVILMLAILLEIVPGAPSLSTLIMIGGPACCGLMVALLSLKAGKRVMEVLKGLMLMPVSYKENASSKKSEESITEDVKQWHAYVQRASADLFELVLKLAGWVVIPVLFIQVTDALTRWSSKKQDWWASMMASSSVIETLMLMGFPLAFMGAIYVMMQVIAKNDDQMELANKLGVNPAKNEKELLQMAWEMGSPLSKEEAHKALKRVALKKRSTKPLTVRGLDQDQQEE